MFMPFIHLLFSKNIQLMYISFIRFMFWWPKLKKINSLQNDKEDIKADNSDQLRNNAGRLRRL